MYLRGRVWYIWGMVWFIGRSVWCIYGEGSGVFRGRVCYIERSMVYSGNVLVYIKKGIIKKKLNLKSRHLIYFGKEFCFVY